MTTKPTITQEDRDAVSKQAGPLFQNVRQLIGPHSINPVSHWALDDIKELMVELAAALRVERERLKKSQGIAFECQSTLSECITERDSLRAQLAATERLNAKLREALGNTFTQAELFNRDGDAVWDAVKSEAIRALALTSTAHLVAPEKEKK